MDSYKLKQMHFGLIESPMDTNNLTQIKPIDILSA